MKYTTKQLNEDCQRIVDNELVPIRIDRGKRYGDADFDGDTLDNVASFDWIGAAIPAYECAKRVKREVLRVTRQHECPDSKSLENACLDGINYLFYTLILSRRDKEPDKPVTVVDLTEDLTIEADKLTRPDVPITKTTRSGSSCIGSVKALHAAIKKDANIPPFGKANATQA